MTPSGKKRLTAVVALVVAAGALVYLAMSNMEQNLVYYWTPSDLLAKADTVKDATIRLGGMVAQGSKQWNGETLSLKFVMSEEPSGTGARITVVSTGAPPQMFREGIGCIVEGKYDGTLFHAERLMVKHSNEYQPPAAGEDPRKLYQTLTPDMPSTHPRRGGSPDLNGGAETPAQPGRDAGARGDAEPAPGSRDGSADQPAGGSPDLNEEKL